MLYLGLDVHSKWMTVRGFDPETGESISFDKVANDAESLQAVFAALPGPLRGAMESGTNSWAVYRHLEEYFDELLVVDPATVWGKQVRRGAKTDQRDAMSLALKLSKGELVGLYVPDRNTQDMRALARAKINASRQVTRLVSETGSVLRSWGIIVECSLLSKKGEELLENAKKELPDLSLKVLNLWLGMLKEAQSVEKELDAAIKLEAKKNEQCKLLMSIPGVGAFTAFVVCAEIGDISRFESAAHLVSYCGLSPSVSQSADKLHYGKLSKFCNRFLKYALVLRGQDAGRRKDDSPFKRTYWRVAIKNHLNDAKIAVARQLTRVIYAMLKNQQCWDSSRFEHKSA